MDALKVLKERKNILNLRQVEKEIKLKNKCMPVNSLSVYLSKGYLPEKWVEPIEAWVRKNIKKNA